ncbi:ketoacyl-ACP synthase III [Adlercreutzia sp. ZJ473]|uniref:ketoacyl-ACP synthase III n=1 Tax=Adlercreutzia sp. ZJ473 TaxID=2722822 RepID=UPI0015535E73|nr:ketoacyl-ACP synthase III [Adlercreutzia sp. ZJ473]
MPESYIRSVEYYLPRNVLANDDLAKLYPEWTAEKIEGKTGIRERRIAAEGETSLDLAESAAIKLFERSDLRPEEVDFLIFVTETPDYVLPASACVLHGRLGLSEACGALDVNLGCSGYVYGLSLAKGLVCADIARNVLLLTADTYSKIIHPMDKSTRTLFGDAAAATWVAAEGFAEIVDFDLGSRGAGYDRLIVPAGMFRNPKSELTGIVEVDENGYSRSEENVFMDGADIMSFSIDVVPKSVDKLLERNGVGRDQVDRFVFHQANAFMLGYLRKKMRIPADRFEVSMGDIGNTVSSSVPIALKRAMGRGGIPEGGRVVLCGFGVGLSWGSALLRIGG